MELANGTTGFGETLLYYTYEATSDADVNFAKGKNADSIMWDDELGPNGEVAKSKHPAFISHTWKTDSYSRGVKQTVTFDKTGALTITPEKGKPIKGTWAVAGPQITLTYLNPETGKEQAIVYKFTFGGSGGGMVMVKRTK